MLPLIKNNPSSIRHSLPGVIRGVVPPHPYIFPTSRIALNPSSGIPCPTDLYATGTQRAVKQAIHKAGITKHASWHKFRHAFATHLFEAASNMMTPGQSGTKKLVDQWKIEL